MTADIQAVRKAAEQLYDWYLPRGHPDRGIYGINPMRLSDGDIAYQTRDEHIKTLTAHALATIPADGHLAITPEYLRDELGAEIVEDDGAEVCQWEGGCIELLQNGVEWEVLVHGNYLANSITTRHQFAQLATALGIQRKRKDGV